MATHHPVAYAPVGRPHTTRNLGAKTPGFCVVTASAFDGAAARIDQQHEAGEVMKNLFVIDGASGSAKNDLVRYISEYTLYAALVRKFTSRPIRDHEKGKASLLDLDFVTKSEFEDMDLDYRYVFDGHCYGFSKDRVREALAGSPDVFVVVRNADTIRELARDFHFLNIVPVFIYTDIAKARERLERQRLPEDQREFCIRRLELAFRDYVRNHDLYREVLINDESKTLPYQLFDQLRKRHNAAPDVNDKLVFVLMSFNPDNPQLADYYEAMKRAVERYDSSYCCVNLEDHADGSFKIAESAKRGMQHCRLAIVDLTENKPNVYYELGYVHGTGTDFIITAHVETAPAFYPREYRIVFYRNASDLEEQLLEQIKRVLR